MKIIIAGNGKMGAALTSQLAAEGDDLTLIDSNLKVLESSEERYDIMVVHGNCASMEVLTQAGVKEADLLIASGADPEKIAIGHMCGSIDASYHEEVLKRGVYVNLDRFGLQGELFHTPTDEQRMDLIQALVDKGYGGKILLGHDSVNVNLGRPIVMTEMMRESLKDANIRTIGAKVLPGLKKRGMSDEQIDALLRANPQSLFAS